jgi:hypothetical protein
MRTGLAFDTSVLPFVAGRRCVAKLAYSGLGCRLAPCVYQQILAVISVLIFDADSNPILALLLSTPTPYTTDMRRWMKFGIYDTAAGRFWTAGRATP